MSSKGSKPSRGTADRTLDTSKDTVGELLHFLLELEEIDKNIFRANSLVTPWGRVFGGQLVAQALVAAGRTTADRFVAHSLHSYFLRPGDVNRKVLYRVARVRDGRNFCARNVTALQQGKEIFVMSVSFQTVSGPALIHQEPMPLVPTARNLISKGAKAERRREMVFGSSLPIQMLHMRSRDIEATRREFEAKHRVRLPPDGMSERRRLRWVKASVNLDDLLLNQCILAYISDWGLLGTAMMKHGIHKDKKVQMSASLDHSMWFHAPFKCGDWLLYTSESPRASGTRGLNFGRVYTGDGVHIVSMAQEGLVRIAPLVPDAERSKL